MSFSQLNVLEVWIDVDIVSIVKKFNVTARGHLLKTVSTQEMDAVGGVLTPTFHFLSLGNFPASDRLLLDLSYLKREEAGWSQKLWWWRGE